jgi:hypothetical protein
VIWHVLEKGIIKFSSFAAIVVIASIIAPLKKAGSFFKCIVLGAFCHKGTLIFLESVSKVDSFDIHHDHI